MFGISKVEGAQMIQMLRLGQNRDSFSDRRLIVLVRRLEEWAMLWARPRALIIVIGHHHQRAHCLL